LITVFYREFERLRNPGKSGFGGYAHPRAACLSL
jgi:hypothetical protein